MANVPDGIERKEVRKEGGCDLFAYESGPEGDPGERKLVTGFGGQSSPAWWTRWGSIVGYRGSFGPKRPGLRRP